MDSQSHPPASLALAEQILARQFGGNLRLVLQPSPEGGSRRSILRRCQVLDGPSAAPPSVILKQVNLVPGQVFSIDTPGDPAQTFLNEYTSLAFLTQLAGEGHQPIAPRLYGANSATGLLVMEDLGQGQSLVQPLLGDDRAAAEAALDTYFRTLGRLGALTHPHRARYWEIRDRLGPPTPHRWPSMANELASLQRHLDTVCTATGITPAAGVAADLAEAARFNAAPDMFAALSQSDTCPDNCMREGDWACWTSRAAGCAAPSTTGRAPAATSRPAGASTSCRARPFGGSRQPTAPSWPAAAQLLPTTHYSTASW
jgi:hypothetical protein